MTVTNRSTRRAATVLAGVAALTTGTLLAPAAGATGEGVPQPDQPRIEQLQRATQEAAQNQAEVRMKGTPPGRRTPVTDALDAGMAKVVADGAIGVTVRVDSPHLTWRGSAGVREQGRKAPAGWQDRYRVASNTKMMVATLILQEVEKGTFTLDTPVNEVVPDLLPGHPETTVRQVLAHTSGMPNGTAEVMMPKADPVNDPLGLKVVEEHYTIAEHLAAVNENPWTEPGAFVYSNGGYVVLEQILVEVTGQDLGTLLEERIFGPVGMNRSSYPTTPGINGPVLQEDAWLGPDFGMEWWDLSRFDPTLFRGAGAVVSTTRDMSAFTQALATGELVNPALLAEMATPTAASGGFYGLGLMVMPDPCSTPESPEYLIGHDGASMGTLSMSLTSTDGERRVNLAATGRDYGGELLGEPRWDLTDIVVPALQATCG